jgi:hypothetical protein
MVLIFYSYWYSSAFPHATFILLVYVREHYISPHNFPYLFHFMLKTVFFIKLLMSSLLIIMLFLVAQFVPTIDGFLFGQPKLKCIPCICHPGCHCETKCVQKQIMKECNLGVDSHNVVFASHYTQQFCNCYRSHQNVKQQAIARQNTEHYNIALKQMIAPQADQGPPKTHQSSYKLVSTLIAIALQLELRRPRLNHY